MSKKSLEAYVNIDDFMNMSDTEKDGQALTWALLFIISEVAETNRSLFEIIQSKGLFTVDELKRLTEGPSKEQRLGEYDYIAKVFQIKYDKIRFAMDNPEQVVVEAADEENSDG